MNGLESKIGFITKVLVISGMISILIKYGGQQVAIAPTTLNAILGITIPPVLMIVTLIWRSRNQPSTNS